MIRPLPPLPTRRRRRPATALLSIAGAKATVVVVDEPAAPAEPAPRVFRRADRRGQVWEHADVRLLNAEVARKNRRMRPAFPPHGGRSLHHEGLGIVGPHPAR